MRVPLDTKIKDLADIPYTISYVIRKRIQLDNLNELPKDKRPPLAIIWDGTSQELDNWIDEVFDNKTTNEMSFLINDVEG